MKRLRLIKPWRLRAVKQRVISGGMGYEGTTTIVACKAPVAEDIINLLPRNNTVGRIKGLIADSRSYDRSRTCLIPYFEIKNFSGREPNKKDHYK